MFDLIHLESVAKEAALKAAEFLIQKKHEKKEIISEDGRDIKLEIDQKSEQLIRKVLVQTNISILGEELGGEENDELLWVIDPIDGSLVTDNFLKEVEQVLENVKSVLESGGSNLDNIIKLTVFITDMKNFKYVNEVFETFFINDYPSRSVVEVSGLPLNVNIEIEAIGIKV